jgi:hypothetical protein
MCSQALFGLTLLPPGCNLVVLPFEGIMDKPIAMRIESCRYCKESIKLMRFHGMNEGAFYTDHVCPKRDEALKENVATRLEASRNLQRRIQEGDICLD